MPELFIWYHAPADIENELRQWLSHLKAQQGIRGRLFVRHEKERTTFMEVYTAADADMLATIESQARQQTWYHALQSPRRCESFKEIVCDE
ncbi:MAG: DUF4936 family protein, partial [Mariprofundaceae bacterium]|nr:DUF4936 family protein [Mariprofundaceae bacterium]